MAVTGGSAQTLLDIAKTLNPDDTIATLAELLNQLNDILTDAQWVEANGPFTHRVSVRTGLPAVAWRLLNGPATQSKSTKAQLDEATGMLETWSTADVDVVQTAQNVQAYRFSESISFIEAMNQEVSKTLFYGDTTVNPERFLGLAPRFSTVNTANAANAVNVLDGGGTGSNNTSVWLVVWGDNSVYGLYPKGTRAGLVHNDLGIDTVTITAGLSGGVMRAYRDQYQWKLGLCVKDWRYVVRLCNINVSDLQGSTGTQNAQQLINFMSRMLDLIPSWGMGRAAIYLNRTVFSMLRIQALNKSSAAIAIEPGLSQFGDPVRGGLSFFGIPIRRCDQILNTEARLT